MFIARQLRDKNIAEYLIYMWQVEDLIRANDCDINKIESLVISGYQLTEEKRNELIEWYEGLIGMMREEGVTGMGHLQVNKNILISLTDLHLELLCSSKYPFYSAAYFNALPFIVELRAKSGKTEEPELETCFEALYGVMLLRLQKREISMETGKAISGISKLVSLLANYYEKEKAGELKFDN